MTKNRALVACFILLMLGIGANGFVNYNQSTSLRAVTKTNGQLARQAKDLSIANRRFLQGKQGLPGVKGTGGVIGAVGPAGQSGGKGLRGFQGVPGAQGLATIGPQGPFGAIGADGPAGKDGAPGKDGLNGSDGAPGADGATGPQGPPPAGFRHNCFVPGAGDATPDGTGFYDCPPPGP